MLKPLPPNTWQTKTGSSGVLSEASYAYPSSSNCGRFFISSMRCLIIQLANAPLAIFVCTTTNSGLLFFMVKKRGVTIRDRSINGVTTLLYSSDEVLIIGPLDRLVKTLL